MMVLQTLPLGLFVGAEQVDLVPDLDDGRLVCRHPELAQHLENVGGLCGRVRIGDVAHVEDHIGLE